MDKITKDTIIGDVVNTHPDLAPVFVKHGLGCVGCAFASQETIEQGSNSHGLKMDSLLNDLNKKLEEVKDDVNEDNDEDDE